VIQSASMVCPGLRAEIDQLIKLSAATDGFDAVIYTDASINYFREMACSFSFRNNDMLAGYLFVFAPTQEEVEITALVHPDYRKRGVFTALLAASSVECAKFGYHRGFLFFNEASATGRQMMSHWGKSDPHHAEYQMCYDIAKPVNAEAAGLHLERVTLQDIELVAPLMAEVFGNDIAHEKNYLVTSLQSADRIQWMLKKQDQIIGFCGEYQEGQEYNVFGLGILPAERRKGYARRMLDLVVNEAIAHDVHTLNLDVDSENPNALSLYQSYGFVNRSVTGYFDFEF
jgi:ribosomal protein S18 acetylase RimI-like enzyme